MPLSGCVISSVGITHVVMKRETSFFSSVGDHRARLPAKLVKDANQVVQLLKFYNQVKPKYQAGLLKKRFSSSLRSSYISRTFFLSSLNKKMPAP